MIRVVTALLTLLLSATALPRPVILQSTETIPPPDPTYTYFGYGLAIDGDWAIITGEKWQDPNDAYSAITQTAYLFRRVNSRWVLQRKLVEQTSFADYSGSSGLAMREGIAVVLLSGGLRVFELSGNDYVARSVTGSGGGLGGDIDISNRRILLGSGECAWNGTILEFSTANNRWQGTTTLPGESKDGCDDEFHGGPVEISGDLAWVDGGGVFHRSGGTTWNPVPMWSLPAEQLSSGAVALNGPNAFVSGSGRYGTHVLKRDASSGAWQVQDHLQTVNGMYSLGGTWAINPEGNFVFTLNHEEQYQFPVVNVFQLNSNGRYTHAGKIIPKAGENANTGWFVSSGRRVLIGYGSGSGPVGYLELPATLPSPQAVIQSTFNTDAAGWTAVSGQFATAPAQTGSGNPGRVYRQSSITGEAIATLNDSDWTNQAVEADVRPTQFANNDRWVGLATRFTDAANYYYVTARRSGNLLLRRKVNGVFTTLASAPLEVAINTDYRLRLEAAGDRLRVFVNGVKVLEAHDGALSHGRAALITYMARADFDNVVVTPSPSTPIYVDRFNSFNSVDWDETPTGAWLAPVFEDLGGGYSFGLRQTSVAGDARMAIGVPTDDQVVQFTAIPRSFADGNDRWFGVMARLVDASNYYYMTVRSSNTVSLRKLTNGAITVLATVPLTVSADTSYALRLEAVGSQLRGYVNGRLLVEATDTTHVRGKGGAVMYKTSADFLNYRAYQP
jgi:hypothetical protein